MHGKFMDKSLSAKLIFAQFYNNTGNQNENIPEFEVCKKVRQEISSTLEEFESELINYSVPMSLLTTIKTNLQTITSILTRAGGPSKKNNIDFMNQMLDLLTEFRKVTVVLDYFLRTLKFSNNRLSM